MKKKFYWRFSRKIEGEFWIFTRDFPGKKIEWKKFLKGFLWKIEAGFTPALVLHVLYFPLKLSLIVSEEAISSRRRPPPPETRTSEASDCEVKSEWSEVKWSEVMPFLVFKFFYFQICWFLLKGTFFHRDRNRVLSHPRYRPPTPVLVKWKWKVKSEWSSFGPCFTGA